MAFRIPQAARLLLVAGFALQAALFSPGPALAQSSLATRGSLSVEAIRIQSAAEKLQSLEDQQKQFTKRTSDYRKQGIAIGVGVGAAAGYGACMLAKGRKCSAGEAAPYMIAGAAGGGTLGNKKGGEIAETQNVAQARENDLKKRIAIASQQLSTAQSARKRSEAVLAQHQRQLVKLKRDVAAGRASKASLQQARANAAADAQIVKVAMTEMRSSAVSLNTDKETQQGNPQYSRKLADSQQKLAREEAATRAQYNALVNEINNSAL